MTLPANPRDSAGQHLLRDGGEGDSGSPPSAGTERSELRQFWDDFCDADPVPAGFIERMESAGFARLRKVTRQDLESPFAYERGIHPGGMLWELTERGRDALR